MASALFVQLDSRMRRRAMIDLLDDLNIEVRKRAGVEFIAVANVPTPTAARHQLLPHSCLPIVPARLLPAKAQVTPFD